MYNDFKTNANDQFHMSHSNFNFDCIQLSSSSWIPTSTHLRNGLWICSIELEGKLGLDQLKHSLEKHLVKFVSHPKEESKSEEKFKTEEHGKYQKAV